MFAMKKSTKKKLLKKIGDPGWIWDHLRFDSDVCVVFSVQEPPSDIVWIKKI